MCIVVAQCSPSLFAEELSSSTGSEPLVATANLPALASNPWLKAPEARNRQATFTLAPTAADAFAQRGYRGRGRTQGGSSSGSGVSAAAMLVGAAATITGAAILVYANRPDCRTTGGTYSQLDGCGYGTKVVGGAVLTGGVVGIAVGALTWR